MGRYESESALVPAYQVKSKKKKSFLRAEQ